MSKREDDRRMTGMDENLRLTHSTSKVRPWPLSTDQRLDITLVYILHELYLHVMSLFALTVIGTFDVLTAAQIPALKFSG